MTKILSIILAFIFSISTFALAEDAAPKEHEKKHEKKHKEKKVNHLEEETKEEKKKH